MPRFKTINRLVAHAIITGSGHYSGVTPPSESADQTQAQTVTDALGNSWTLGTAVGSSGDKQTLKNGVPWPPQGAGALVTYYYKNHLVYGRNSSNIWWLANLTAPTPGWEQQAQSPIPAGPVESAEATRGNTVIDSFGNIWTLGVPRSGGLTTLSNGVPWPPQGPGGIVEYYYHNHTVYGRNDANLWFRVDLAAVTWQQATDPTVVAPPPPDPTNETADGAQLLAVVDRYGDTWTISGGAVLRNGTTFINNTGSQGNVNNIDAFMYFRRTVFAHRSSNDWFQWFYTSPVVAGQTRPLGDWAGVFGYPLSFNLWKTGYGRPKTGAGNESTNRTRSTQSVIDYYGRVWSLGGVVDGAGNRLILLNGQPLGNTSPAAAGSAAVELTYMNHAVVMKQANGQYYDWNPIDYGGIWIYMTNFDPLAIEDGTVDYDPGVNLEGLRGTYTEAQMAAETGIPSLNFYGKADATSLQLQWGYNPPAYLPGLVNFTKWPERANVDVVRCGGKPWNGPNMFTLYRGFAPTNSKWLHMPIKIMPSVSMNMHEGGIKLSGMEGDWISIRMWMRPAFNCLPDHHQLAVYVYDLQNELAGGSFGEVLFSSGFIKEGVAKGVSLFVKGNTFSGGAGTQRPDGKYIMVMDGKRIMNITNRVNNFSPDRLIMNRATLQAYHGGLGAPFADPNDPTGNSIEIQYGPHSVSDE